jgi:hypothetical protein
VIASAVASSSVPSPGDGPSPPWQRELAAGGFGAAALLAASIPLAERLVWPDIGGLRWRSLLFGGVVLGVSVAAIGSWAHRPRDATVCERDGVTGRMACSYGQTNIAEQRRAANEYLGGGGLISLSAAGIALWMSSRPRPASPARS